MNIKEAKEQILNTMKAYFTKNEFGEYIIPTEVQRPIFLMGAPGIGKTAIMQQVADEMGVNLVPYSMTHHTRQSALGLPFISKKIYNGKEYDVSEYTMSEIIAAVYKKIESTKIKEGILFLDEINCVSETLSPAMLLFLQYKIFGSHTLPEGWVVVTAGNPPEYNNSVREFDMVTWDRLKRIDVEPVFDVWKEFAYKTGTHASIMTYLEIHKDDFYKIETTVDGKSFVTARGWSDLSSMIKLYEKNSIKVDEKLVSQYIQHSKIAKDFAIYYDLWNKYKSDYQIPEILDGKVSEGVKIRAKNGAFDERLSVLGLIIESIVNELYDIFVDEKVLTNVVDKLKVIKASAAVNKKSFAEVIEETIEGFNKELHIAQDAGTLTQEKRLIINKTIAVFDGIRNEVLSLSSADEKENFIVATDKFTQLRESLKKQSDKVRKKLTNAFNFCEEVFGEGDEILILVTEMTVNPYGAHFISRYGCEEYFKFNKNLLFYERQKKLIGEIERFDFSEDI